MFIHMLMALASVSVNAVVVSFETLLEARAPASSKPSIDYFEDNITGHLTRRNVRRQPLFGLNTRNVSARVADVLPKISNSVEGWRRGFQSSPLCSHPFWKFIEQLRKEEALQHFSTVQLMSGVSIFGYKKCRTRNACSRISWQDIRR